VLVSGLTVLPCGELSCSVAGFLDFALFEFVSAVNLKNKRSTVLNGVPVFSAAFPAGKVVGSKSVPVMHNICSEH